MPAVSASLRLGALAMRSLVKYAGQNGWEITMSASGSSRSNSESGPSLSEVTTNSCPPSSKNLRSPSAPDTQPTTRCEVDLRWGRDDAATGVAVDRRDAVACVLRRIAVEGVGVQHHHALGHGFLLGLFRIAFLRTDFSLRLPCGGVQDVSPTG